MPQHPISALQSPALTGAASSTAPTTAAVPGPVLPLAAMAASLPLAWAGGWLSVTPIGLALAGLSLGVAGAVLPFAARQLRAHPRRNSLLTLAGGLVIATVLLGLAANVTLLAAAWFVSGRLMVGLIGHAQDRHEAGLAASRASRAFLAGDLAVIAALILLTLGAGSTTIAAIAPALATMPPLLVSGAALLLGLGALVRCAAPPVSGWLLSSLAAPTPVSALMHAGFVNAGGFLLIRFAPVIEATPVARFVLLALGLVAVVHGTLLAMVRADVKGGLAASTVAQMGFMVMTCALGAYAAALWHMVAHGLFKAWLFLGANGTLHAAPKRDAALAEPAPALIAMVTLLLGLIAVTQGYHDPALVPLGLALALLLGTALMAFTPGAITRPRPGLVVVAIAVIAANLAIVAAIAGYVPSAAQPLLSPQAQFGLLSLLLAGWVWQHRLIARRIPLPLALHAHLIHAGSLDAQTIRKD